MKTINKILLTALFVSFGLLTQAQINTKVNTKKVVQNPKVPNAAFKPILVSKTNSASLAKSAKEIKNASVREIDVPKSYWNRRSVKRRTITPQKPFSYGVGFSFHGSFDKDGFGLNKDAPGLDAYGNIRFLAKKDKEYLIHVKAQPRSASQLIVLIRDRTFYKVTLDEDKIYRLLVKATESGEMMIHIAASPNQDKKLLISQIQIDEI